MNATLTKGAVLTVRDVVRFGDRDVQCEIVEIRKGWILARTTDPSVPYGYIVAHQEDQP